MDNVVYRTSSQPMLPSARVITDVSAFYGLTNADVIAIGEDVKAGEVYNLLSTYVGDEPHLPLFGCDLPKRVFQPINGVLVQQMVQDVYLASKTWVPDVLVVANQCRVIASASKRVAGLVVGYNFGGELWHLPIHLVDDVASNGLS